LKTCTHFKGADSSLAPADSSRAGPIRPCLNPIRPKVRIGLFFS